jgi:hypothetical protein
MYVTQSARTASLCHISSLWTGPTYIILMVGEYSRVREVFADGSLSAWGPFGQKMSLCPTKYVYIKITTVYVPSSELGLSQPLSRQQVGGGGTLACGAGEGWGSHNSDDWRKSLALCLLFALSLLYHEIFR